MKKNQQETSLLERLTSNQVEDLIIEHELKEKGYVFSFCIDNHDIVKYCFPGNFDGHGFELKEDNTANYELETELSAAYTYFYTSIIKQTPVYLLDEYRDEFEGLRKQIINKINSYELINYADTFLDYYETILPSEKNKIKEHFTTFISIATGLISNGAERYNKILLMPNFIRDFDDAGGVVDESILELINKTRDIIIESQKRSLENTAIIYKDLKRLRRKSNGQNSLIDSAAIARTLFLNYWQIKERKKNLFFFLSSTHTIKKFFNEFNYLVLEVEGRKLNFHRTGEQIFLLYLLKDLDLNERLKRLKEAKEITLNREKYYNEIKKEKENINSEQNKIGEQLNINIKESFAELREKYIEINLSRNEQFSFIVSLHDKLNRATRNNSLVRLNSLYSQLKKISEKYGNKNENLIILNNLGNTYKFEQVFCIALKSSLNMLNERAPIIVSRGDDVIMGTGQHMPLAFLSVTNENFFLDEIAEFYLNLVAHFKSTTSDDSVEIANKLRSLAHNIFETNFHDKTNHEKLIFSLYLLILPQFDDYSIRYSNSEKVQFFLAELIESGVDKTDNELYSDFLYVLAWVCRRNNNYVDAYKYTKIGISFCSDDPRFYHSLFLIDICRLNKSSVIGKFSEYTQIIKSIDTALNLYPDFLKNKSQIIKTNILCSLINSKIYNQVFVVHYDRSSNGMQKALVLERIRQRDLRQLKDEIGEAYEAYPEFLHTEAFLEFHEAFYEVDSKKKISKLNFAKVSIDKAIRRAEMIKNYKIENYKILYQDIVDQIMTLT